MGQLEFTESGNGNGNEKDRHQTSDRSRGHYKPDWLASSYIAYSWNLAEHFCATLSVIIRGI